MVVQGSKSPRGPVANRHRRHTPCLYPSTGRRQGQPGGETVSEIRLQRLTLSNFKGIKSLELDLAGHNASIYGANATGKTTIYDAFLWLLFDKDSQNKSAFNIKTLDESGEPLHGLDHEVEAVLSVDGQELTLKKSYKEKWTKRRGSATAEFTGHTTDYYIDGVPVKKSEYEKDSRASPRGCF